MNIVKTFLKTIIFAGAAGILLCKTFVQSILVTGILCLLVSIILAFRTKDEAEKRVYIHREFILVDVVITVLMMKDFYIRWMPSGIIGSIAGRLRLPSTVFLAFTAIILGVFTLHTVDYVVNWLKNYIIDVEGENLTRQSVTGYMLIAVVVLIQNFLLNYSTIGSISKLWNQDMLAIICSTAILASLNILILLIVRNWKLTLIATSVVVWIWSVVNFYVIKFHGSPLYLSELANVKTAAEVAGAYKYSLSKTVVVVTALFVFAEAVTCIYVPGKSGNTKKSGKAKLELLAFCAALSIASYWSIDPDSFTWASWYETVTLNGFPVETVNDLYFRLNPLKKPEDYDIESVEIPEADHVDNIRQYPDIILILNETFCNLDYSVITDADVDYLEAFRDIEGAVYGNAVVANIGGGTNDSEFELLTSKSKYLLKSSSPFTFMTNYQLERSVVGYLKDLGYETTGMHSGPANNYSRKISYPVLGFEHIYLGGEAFKYHEKNGNRPWLDSENYRDLIDHYSQGNEDPRFMFLLTYQNHGGYEQNDETKDTVHAGKSFGALTDEVNEFLSSIKLSSDAFRALTDYYRNCDRDVIICMVGDHAPSFISGLPDNTEQPVKDSDIKKKTVPYVIWSNFGADLSFYTEYATMTDLVPMVLRAANIPLSPFYKTILELHEKLPIRTSSGKYIDRSFKEGSFGNGSDYEQILKNYYYMAYNSLLKEKEYVKEWFCLEK